MILLVWRTYQYPLYISTLQAATAIVGQTTKSGIFVTSETWQQDVQTQGEMWDWLNYTVPELFWVYQPPSPTMATYNQLLGYFSIRVQ